MRMINRAQAKALVLSLIVAIGTVIILSQAAHAQVIDRIVAIVNDEVITLNELNQALRPYVDNINSAGYTGEQREKILFKLRSDMLTRMVDRMLTDQEVRRYNITVTDKEIDAAIERLKQAQRMTQEDLLKALDQDGMTFADYREKMRQEILRPKLINYSVKSKVVVTDREVAAYYTENMAEYAGVRKYRLLNILLTDRDVAASVRERLENGEEFKDLAREFSKAPNAGDGGLLGSFTLDTLSKQLQTAVGRLDQGEYTDVLSTDQGFQIFFLDGIVETREIPLDDVKEEIQRKLYDQIVEEKFNSWLESLREKSHIKTMI
ncbi:MAG: SurA N-terminal domain-containing protein [Desulfobacterium sp.]|jgi:peptidyl-prolyl cis-trans isomerase SurA|nr:SurA N-terminal domain-containing protein [Desulfobacterium sp.]